MNPYQIGSRLLTLDHVHVRLNDVLIVEDLSAHVDDIVRPGVKQGQVVGMLGPSGVGKSVLSRAVAGLLELSAGSIVVGTGPTRRPIQLGDVGFVQQHYPLFHHRTVRGNLLVAACQRGLSPHEAEQLMCKYMAEFQLLDKLDQYPSTLSGGQRQRIAIVQQLLSSRAVLILDEPFTGLDPIMRDRMVQLIRRVAQVAEETTLLVVAHDVDAVVDVADTVWLIGRREHPDGTPGGIRHGGCYVRQQWDLAGMGLAWTDHPAETPAGRDLVRQMKESFRDC